MVSFSEVNKTGNNQVADEKHQEFSLGDIKFRIAMRSPIKSVIKEIKLSHQ